MQGNPFTVVIEDIPGIIVVTPYGMPKIEMVNTITEALNRADIAYSLNEYAADKGVAVMVDELYMPATNIYVVEWSVREYQLRQFRTWYPEHIVVSPKFTPDHVPSHIITHEGNDKMRNLRENITTPSAIYTDNRTLLHQLRQSLLPHGLPVTIRWTNVGGYIITDDIHVLKDVPSHIPIHMITMGSSDIMELLMGGHQSIHVYVGDQDHEQYRLLQQGITSANDTYTQLLAQARPLVRDKYNTLYIQ